MEQEKIIINKKTKKLKVHKKLSIIIQVSNIYIVPISCT